MASQVTHPSKAYRESWMVVTPTYSGGSDACCNYDYSCPEGDRGIGCVPDARAFHQMNPGLFTGGRLSMIVYGGLDRTGRSLGDLWVMDAQDQSEGKSYFLILRNVTVSTFTAARRAEPEDELAVGDGWEWALLPSRDDAMSRLAAHYRQPRSRLLFASLEEVALAARVRRRAPGESNAPSK